MDEDATPGSRPTQVHSEPGYPEVGEEFAGFRILSSVARGGMGVVFRAEQRRPRRPVALKVLAPELSASPEYRERFRRESELAASIEHPNVVPVYAVDEHEGRLFIAMRYIEGTDLQRLGDGPLGPGRAARIVAQIGTALDAAHAKGLVHRDVKPANILIADPDGDEHAYLSDFGIARPVAAGEGLTRTGAWVGTVDYMAPETIEGRTIDARADVYSLGCVLFHALTGQAPFPGKSEVSKMWAHLNEPPPTPSAFAGGLPPDLDTVVQRAMAKEPNERYPSAGDLGQAALAAATGGPEPATAGTVAIGEAARGIKGPLTPPTASDVPSGRRRWQLLAVGLVAATAVAAGAIVLTGGENAESPAAELPYVAGEAVPLGAALGAIAADAEAVWTVDSAENRLIRYDPATEEIVKTKVGREPFGVAVGDGVVWVVAFRDGTLARYDARTLKPIGDPIPVGGGAYDVALGYGSAWVASYESDAVYRVDQSSGKPRGTVRVGDGPTDVAAGEGAVWVTNVEEDTLSRINPAGGTRTSTVGNRPESIAVGEGFVWIAHLTQDQVTRVDPNETQGPSVVDVDERPDDVVVGLGSVWVANSDGNSVSRIDPAGARIVGAPIAAGDGAASLAIGGGTVWVANFGAGTIVPLAPGE